MHVQSDPNDALESAESSVFAGDLAERFQKVVQRKKFHLKMNNDCFFGFIPTFYIFKIAVGLDSSMFCSWI